MTKQATSIDPTPLVSLATWEELFPRSDWRYEVDNGDTSLGWDAWLENKAEMEMADIEEAVGSLAHGASRTYRETPGLEAVARLVADSFNTLRMCDDEAYARAQQVLGKDHDPEELVFGETFCVLPEQARQDLSRLAHLGMVAWEGRADFEKIDRLIIAIHRRHGLAQETAEAAACRLDLESHELTVEPTPDAVAAFTMQARLALRSSLERLEINDLEGEEAPFIAEVRAALVMAEALGVEPEAAERFEWPQSVVDRFGELEAKEDESAPAP